MYVGSIPAVTSILSVVGMLACASCLPTRAAHVAIPVLNSSNGPIAGALVDFDRAALAQRLDGFDPARVAFYVAGREPTPHRWIDSDGDGSVDRARLRMLVGARTEVVIVCPGPQLDPERSASIPLEGPPTSQAAVDYARARR